MKPLLLMRLVWLLAFAGWVNVSVNGQDTDQGVEFFETNIRPLLVEHCYRCHNSVDLSEGSLVLDTKAGTLKGGDNGSIIEPGNVEKSRLIAILKHEVPGLEMPEDAKKLSDKEIANFEKWISLGAPDPRIEPPSMESIQALRSWDTVLEQRKKEAWAFQPIRSPTVPEVTDPRWAATPIDRFAFSKMQEKGLKPVERAENSILVRRLFFVLIGLPPTSAEVKKWSQEIETKEGYDRLVNDLLNRPQFGERWARHWMDWTRYADSHGSEGDPGIENGWYYRDYLIRALNADVSYPQLVREHVAGDLLAEPRINRELGINESLIGTAHWRMVFHGFSPTDALDEKVRFIDDQINTFSKAFLGLTLSCARCHHHKFDPISQEDYYATFGVLASCRPARHAIDVDAGEADRRQAMLQLKQNIRGELAARWLADIQIASTAGAAEIEKWADIKDPTDVRFPLANIWRRVRDGEAFEVAWKDECHKHEMHRTAVEKYATEEGVQYLKFSNPATVNHWYFEGKGLQNKVSPAGEFAIAAEGDSLLTGIYPSGVYSHLLSSKDPARLTSEDLLLTDKYQVWMRLQGDGTSQTRYAVQDYPRNGVVFPTAAIGPKWHWQKFDVAYWKGDEIHLELATGKDAPLLVNSSNRSWFGITETLILPADRPGPPEPLFQQTGFYRFAVEKMPKSLEDVWSAYWQGIAVSVERWRDQQCDDMDAYWLAAALENKQLFNSLAADEKLSDLIRQYRALEESLRVPTRVPGLDETVGRDNELYIRGNHKQLGAKVPRRFLQAIDAKPYATEQSGRMQLADELLRPENPLTYRVFVNRIWHHLFGRGIVLTTDNFGKLGSLPSDPELLDYLASDFRDRKAGSLKELIRDLVSTEVWKLSTRPSEESRVKDPENDYLSHANLRRIEAEAIRDSLLSVSGLLQGEMYGPPIDGNTPRRSVYMRVQRNALDPFLRAFDFPEPFSCTGRRDITNVPAQSLAFMNDRAVTQWANTWASQVLGDPAYADDASRIKEMFQTVTGRLPSSEEVSQLQHFLRDTEEEQKKLLSLMNAKRERVRDLQSEIAAVVDPAREKLIQAMTAEAGKSENTSAELTPVSRWEFKGSLNDSIGGLPLTLHEGARLEGDHLVVGPQGYALSAPLKQELRAKTLEAWVQLDNLDQQGGVVLSVQTQEGGVFDAIVFGEQQSQHWLPGSNGFERTKSLGGYDENDAVREIVHVAISYHPDGRIVGFRNGKPYGNAYQSNGPMTFRASETVVGLGVRHLPAQGNRLLNGKIYRAQLYDRALSAEEVEASYRGFPAAVTMENILASLGEAERNRAITSQQELEALRKDLSQFNDVAEDLSPESAWGELAQALFSLKEFIFIQ